MADAADLGIVLHDGCKVAFGGETAAARRQWRKNEIATAPPGVYRIANPEVDADRDDRVVRVGRATLYVAAGAGHSAYAESFDQRSWKADVLFERVDAVTSVTFTFGG